ncbi:MAG: response regulator [Alphaproteobacteria bacterium]
MDDMLSRHRILVLEDEMMITILLEELLDELGCRNVVVTRKPAQALRVLTEKGIDAAILDVNLNGQDSFVVADALAGKGIPFIFCTGYSDRVVEPKYADRQVLKKPFRLYELETALRRILQ